MPKLTPAAIIFQVRHQFTLYLQRVGVRREMLPPDQLREMSRAFYGAWGQMLILMREDISRLSEDDGVQIMQAQLDEVGKFWEDEEAKQFPKS